MKTTASCWPTFTQELLLKAVLCTGLDAHSAWQEWLSHIDFFEDKLTGGSYQLLPLVYRNFIELGFNDPLMGRLKGLVRNNWTRNQLLINDVINLLKKLSQSGISFLLLASAALELGNYHNAGMVLIDHFDIFIPSGNTRYAHTILSRLNWIEDTRYSFIKTQPTYPFHTRSYVKDNNQHLYIHTHLPFLLFNDFKGLNFSENVKVIKLNDLDTLTLQPEDQVLLLCIDGLLFDRRLAVNWLANVGNILKVNTREINWQRLVTLSQQHQFSLAIGQTLRFLSQQCSIQVPRDILRALDDTNISQFEKKEWQLVSQIQWNRWSLMQRLRRLYYGYSRIDPEASSQLWGLIRFLHYYIRNPRS
jgi:hypothetical protein